MAAAMPQPTSDPVPYRQDVIGASASPGARHLPCRQALSAACTVSRMSGGSPRAHGASSPRRCIDRRLSGRSWGHGSMSDEEPDSVLLPRPAPEIAIAIAHAISAWAYFEHRIDEVTWRLAGLEPEQGACLTAQYQTVAARFDALISLSKVEKLPSKYIKRLNIIKERALRLSNMRNRLVHDPWFFGYTTRATYRREQTARSILDRGYKEVSEENIREFERKIVEITRDLGNIDYDMLTAS
jgi:hypothetical protein